MPDGALVRIKDIGRVELGAKTSDSAARFNGKPSAGIQIYQLPGANALATAQAVRKLMKELEPRMPEDVAYDVMYDTTVFVAGHDRERQAHADRGLHPGRRSSSSSSSATCAPR